MKLQRWHGQFIRFNIVGLASTLLHVAVAFALLDILDFSLMASNVGAFAVAISFSYMGHARWSFETNGELKSMLRFCVASGVNLLLIIGISHVVTVSQWQPYMGIVLVAVIIPLVGFFMQKLWVFER